jgi:rod shape-determining protein MreD
MLEYLQIGVLWAARQIWYSLPLLVTLAALLLALAPLNLFQGQAPAPDVVLASVFFWAIFGPQFLPAWAVFALGLTQDLATGAPFGFWALIYLVAYGFALSQRVFFFGRTVRGVWLGFIIVALVSAFVTWIVGSTYFSRWLPIEPILLQAVVSIVVFPFAAKAFFFVRGFLTTAREGL